MFRLTAGEQPVGWLWLAVPFPGGDPAMAWVNYVQVDPEFRGRGYGRQAMLLAEREARGARHDLGRAQRPRSQRWSPAPCTTASATR